MKAKKGIIGSVIFIVVGIYVVFAAIKLKIGTPLVPQPGFFPFISGLLLAVLSIILLLNQLIRKGQRPSGKTFGDLQKPAILTVSMIIYLLLLDYFGYIIPTALLSLGILMLLGVTSWKVIIFTSVIFTGTSYVIFKILLGIDLPPEILSF